MKRHLSFISIAWPRIFYSHTIQMCGRAGCQLQFAHKKWFVHWFVHWLRFFFHFGPTIRSHFQIIYFTQMIWISTDVLNNFIRQCMQFSTQFLFSFWWIRTYSILIAFFTHYFSHFYNAKMCGDTWRKCVVWIWPWNIHAYSEMQLERTQTGAEG